MFSVTIEFGENPETRETFHFDSEDLMNAFLDGIEKAIGWMDYEIIEKDDPEQKQKEQESINIRNAYADQACPDCAEEIPLDVVDGQECKNCGHVFQDFSSWDE